MAFISRSSTIWLAGLHSLQAALDNIAFKSIDGKLKNIKKTFYAEDKDFIIARTAYHRLRLMVNTKKPENNMFLDHISEYIEKHIKYYNEECLSSFWHLYRIAGKEPTMFSPFSSPQS